MSEKDKPTMRVRLVDAICETCGHKAVLIEVGERIEGNPICPACTPEKHRWATGFKDGEK